MITIITGTCRHALGALAAAIIAIGCSFTAPAYSQDRYPSRTITIVVPYPPAGLADLMARPLAAALERELKQNVIVLNKPGAAGGIGIQSVAKGPADGYTMLVSLVSISTLVPVGNQIRT